MRAPIASAGANRPATCLHTGTRERSHRPQPRQVLRRPDRRLRKPTPAERQSQWRPAADQPSPASAPRHGPLGSTPAAGEAARLNQEPPESRPATPAPTPDPGVGSKCLQSLARFLWCCVFFVMRAIKKAQGCHDWERMGNRSEVDRLFRGNASKVWRAVCSQTTTVLIILNP